MRFTIMAFLLLSAHFAMCQTDIIELRKEAYKIEYPKSWTLDTSGRMGAELFILSPMENESDKFRENLNIIIQDLSGQNINLEKYKEITDRQFEQLGESGRVYGSGIGTCNGFPCFQTSYMLIQNGFKLRASSICEIKNDKAYLVTFTTDFNKYDQYKKSGEDMLSSFSLFP